MADGKTYGINFPFRQSQDGKYLSLSQTPEEEIRTDLLHLILTRKGSRYYLPNFGTRIYEFIFEPMDGLSFEAIKADIRQSVDEFLPNLVLNDITITPYTEELELIGDLNMSQIGVSGIYRVPGTGVADYTAKIRIDYQVTSDSFASSDFVIINI